MHEASANDLRCRFAAASGLLRSRQASGHADRWLEKPL